MVRELTIKKARKAAGLTQLEMAKLMGIPARTIQNWEGGQRKWTSYPIKNNLKKF